MEKKIVMSIAALAISGMFLSAGFAQQASPTASQKPAVTQKTSPGEKWEKIQGVIEKIEEATKSVTVRTQENKMMTFSMGQHTYLTEVTTRIPLSALRKGMPVTVEYAREGTMLRAEWIDLTKPGAETKPVIIAQTKEGKKENPATAEAPKKEIKKEAAPASATPGKEVQKESPSPKPTEKK